MSWKNIPILAYHKISNKIGWGVTNVPIRFFYRQMQFLYENGYSSISIADVNNNLIPSSNFSKKIMLTFDDADISVYENAFPIMKQMGFVGIVFVITDYVGKADTWDANPIGRYSHQMDWRHLRELVENGWAIGSHTASHPDLTSLDDQKLQDELKHSKEILESELGMEISALSYPFNRFNSRVLEETLRAGYKNGFILGKSAISDERYQPLLIPRLGVYLFDGNWSFKTKMCQNKLAFQLQNIISKFSAGSILWKKLIR